jgi:hypothetical protein
MSLATKRKLIAQLKAGDSPEKVYSDGIAMGLKPQTAAVFAAAGSDQAKMKQLRAPITILALSWLVLAVASAYAAFVFLGLMPKAKPLAYGLVALPLLIGGCIAWNVWQVVHGGYVLSISFAMLQISSGIKGALPGGVSMFSVLVGAVLVGLSWWLMRELFPYMSFFGPKKVNGQYAFVSKPS